MEALVQAALLRHSTAYKGLEPGVLAELVDVAAKAGADTGALAASFDRFMTINRFGAAGVTLEDVEAFAASERSASAKALADKTNLTGGQRSATTPSQRISPYLHTKTAASAQARAAVNSPLPSLARESGTSSTPLRPTEASAQLVSSHNPGLATCAAGATPAAIRILGTPLPSEARFGTDSLEDRAALLEQRIRAVEVEAAGRDGAEAHPVGSACQDATLFVGRICCDTEEGRLNPQSLLLEGSQALSGGARVRLDVSRLAAFRLFPGQVVSLRGTNPSGHCIIAAELCGTREPDAKTSPSHPAAPTSVVLAAGPYCCPENLEYAPLHALLEHCRRLRPAHLLLAGPWVDEAHPLLAGGLVDETFQSIFQTRFLATVEAFSGACPGTRVLLLPSPRDLHLPPVFPAPAPRLAAPATPALTPLPNPTTIMLEDAGLALGCTSVDWLMAVGREELVRLDPGAPAPDRLAQLATHVLEQRSYFPLFPPPPGLPLDARRARAALALPDQTPAVLVLPSDLAPFARLAPGGATLCINPGRAAKGAGAGTFAHLCAAPGERVCDALRCDILRI
ncbi:POLA2 [Auxenochlorella protothecoides x Auxenochlorella symbiontica]